MVTNITMNQALELYASELDREMKGLTQSDRLIKRYSAFIERTKKTVFLSIVDLVREVQNRTEVGKIKAISYIDQLTDKNGDPLYLITG